jgi:hypothetical protein
MADRITQEAAEVFIVPDTQKAVVTGEAAEVFIVPDTQKAVVTQVYAEVFITGWSAAAAERFYATIID